MATSLSELTAPVEAVLSEYFGTVVRLDRLVVIKKSDRSEVARCYVVAATDLPRSVVIKRVLPLENDVFEPANSNDENRALGLSNDWAGAQFLTRVGGDDSPGPKVYGGDKGAGIIVLEDLGAGDTLADLLLGGDRAAAEAALISFSETLGRMHAFTIGRVDEYAALHGTLAKESSASKPWLARHNFEDRVRNFKQACDAFGVAVTAPFENELGVVAARIHEPGPFLAYIHGDPCPDNALYSHGIVRLVDFEFGGFGHALLDATYGRMPFPTCWCVNRLPAGIVALMESSYRAELARGCAQAGEDAQFFPALVYACA